MASSERAPSSQEPEVSPYSSGPIKEGAANAPAAPEALPEGIDETMAITDFRVSGGVFRPRTSNVDWTWGSGGGCIYVTGGSSLTIFNTPLYLPQGSEVLAVRMYYDDVSTNDMGGWLTVHDLYGEVEQEWYVPSVGATGRGFNDTAAINHVVDYRTYSYVLNWRPNEVGSGMQFCGFRVFYDPPYTFGSFMPTTQKNYSAP
jgi:hypothetical protein